MHERVTVTRLLPSDLVEVTCTSSACNGCKGAAFCNTKGKTFEAWNKHHLPVEVGQVIELFLHPGRTIGGTLITLIFPLLLFPVAYWIASKVGVGEGLSFLLGLGGITLGLAMVRLYFNRSPLRYMPIITQTLSEESHD